MCLTQFSSIFRPASALEIPFGGHVPNLVGLRRALASGQSSIDHLDTYVESLIPMPTPLESLGSRGSGVGTIDDA